MRVFCLLFVLAFAGCADRFAAPIFPAAAETGVQHTVFVATSRAREPDGEYRFRRSDQLNLLEMTVSIPSSHRPGKLTYSHSSPNPRTQFTLADREELSGAADLQSRLAREQYQNRWRQREVTIFVHGYNVTQAETVFRGAQIAHDIDLPGSLLAYSWPSRGRAFAYAYDLDSMLFARDGLERSIRMVKNAGAERIILVAHSMGASLTMEMLRQADLREPGWASRTVDSVLLISPDLAVDVFRAQVQSLSAVPQPFFVMVSEKDEALNISARVRGTAESRRLGNIGDATGLQHLPVRILDITAFDQDALSSHFVLATSPSLIALIQSAKQVNQSLEGERPGLEALLADTENSSPKAYLTQGR